MSEMPEPDCRMGLTRAQVVALMGGRIGTFDHWMRGQTMAICDGSRFDYETQTQVPDCGTAHGVVAYADDVQRFLRGLPVVD